MWSGFVLIPTLGGAFREQWISTMSRTEWNEAVERSARTAVAYLTERIVNKVRPVLVQRPDGSIRIVVKQIGYYARGHVADFRSIERAGTPKDVRSFEKRLRNAVRYWTIEFPKDQERLTIELFAQYLKTLPAATDVSWYDHPCKFCAACGDYDHESHKWSVDLCDACRNAPAFHAAAREHLRSMLQHPATGN